MTSSHIEKRLFIVGTPRSGTTLLQSIFAACPDIFTSAETHFFTGTAKAFLGARMGLVYRDPAAFVETYLESMGLKGTQPPFGFGQRVFCLVKPQLLADYLLDRLDHMSISSGKSIWLEKTPHHLRYMRWIMKSRKSDNVFVAHMLRDHDPTVRSYVRASVSWAHPVNARQASLEWEDNLRIHSRYIGAPNHVFVSYEKFLENPEATARRIFETFGIEFMPAYLQIDPDIARKIVRDNEIWKQNNFAKIGQITGASDRYLKLPRAPASKATEMYQKMLSVAV